MYDQMRILSNKAKGSTHHQNTIPKNDIYFQRPFFGTPKAVVYSYTFFVQNRCFSRKAAK
jgi:hypothetical protein